MTSRNSSSIPTDLKEELTTLTKAHLRKFYSVVLAKVSTILDHPSSEQSSNSPTTIPEPEPQPQESQPEIPKIPTENLKPPLKLSLPEPDQFPMKTSLPEPALFSSPLNPASPAPPGPFSGMDYSQAYYSPGLPKITENSLENTETKIPKEIPENTEYNTGSFPPPTSDDFSFSQPQLTQSYNPLNQNITTDSLEIRTISSSHPHSQQKTQNDSQLLPINDTILSES
jgi:hypothetical protein